MQKNIYIVINFLLFLPGFLYFIFYKNISIILYEKLIHMDIYLFWLSYFIALYILYKNASFFIKISDRILIIKCTQSLREKFKRVMNIIFISCYIGFVINVATVFSFATFSFM